MTSKEAIKYIQANYPNCNAYSGLREALDLAVTVLQSQAEKERRYVVKSMPLGNSTFGYIVEDTSPSAECKWVASHITTEQAAQAIADIYEQYVETKP